MHLEPFRGANKSSLLQVYRATIHPLFDYGCKAIDLGCKHKEVCNKIQYQALKICCGGMMGTGSSLLVECGEHPLDLRRKKLMANQALGFFATQNKSVSNKYFISNGRKSKAQVKLYLMVKKKGISTTVETIESLLREISNVSFRR